MQQLDTEYPFTAALFEIIELSGGFDLSIVGDAAGIPVARADWVRAAERGHYLGSKADSPGARGTGDRIGSSWPGNRR
ncbi:hypothetical protein [Halobellus sp. EA9]|uniref:hypothetical protein n=1 Tax=Halobellus sp. EA9 TaxID=3421647 RepID=UPI003EBC5CC6